MMSGERAISFSCAGEQLLGVLHQPQEVRGDSAVLIVVGGPQYRVGSHRQFVLMARGMAAAGWPVLRFDYRGMGDSTGEHPGFENVEADLQAAMDVLTETCAPIERIVVLGLCDAASAALIHASQDRRVVGLILLNPWARTASRQAQTLVSSYYRRRLFSRAFWWDLLAGRLRWRDSWSGLLAVFGRLGGTSEPDFLRRMLAGATRFGGDMLFLLSENDLTAEEFRSLVRSQAGWRALMGHARVRVESLAGADHTLSSRDALDAAVRLCLEWLVSCQHRANR